MKIRSPKIQRRPISDYSVGVYRGIELKLPRYVSWVRMKISVLNFGGSSPPPKKNIEPRNLDFSFAILRLYREYR